MSQPVWVTPVGNLGFIPEGTFYQRALEVIAVPGQTLTFKVIAGTLPRGIQLTNAGVVSGVPLEVSENVTSKFTVRVTTNTVPPRIADRTFELTIVGDDVPEFITPAGSLGVFYDGDFLNIQIQYTDEDADDVVTVKLVGGRLPGGVSISPTGLITGHIQPAADVTTPPGYDLTAADDEPYDFIVSAINANYQFVLELSDGKGTNPNLRTFEFFVYNRDSITADNTTIDADNTIVTADETTERRPFLINADPSNLGVVRGDNYYAYQFIGEDYDTPDLRYAISVNRGQGLPEGLELDPVTGWYYGYVPNQGITEIEYSFNVVVYQSEFVGSPITCTSTTFGTNIITCDDTSQFGVGQPLVFTGTGFGNITAAATTVYYVRSILSPTEFTVATSPTATVAVALLTESGTMAANMIVASNPYPFSLVISGETDAEVTWITDSDLGVIENGSVSLLKIQAVNRGGRELTYRLRPGAFNELPQGLKLLPTGEIAGRVSFNTFSIDLGSTTFDQNATTWDSNFEFTVNAYAEDTEQLLYQVESVSIIDGGSGFSTVNLPALGFSSPVGSTARPAEVDTVTVLNGEIVGITLSDNGSGYTGATGQAGSATISVLEGFGGGGANLRANMSVTGVRDVVSVFKTFRLKLKRVNNLPYQNLEVQAMPPQNDRDLINSLLSNESIFRPDFIFRPTDPYFGKASKVVYQHAFGLSPATLNTYVESLYLNHYWKNLVIGPIETAQAVDDNNNVIYEVVYSRIVDNLVNNQNQSVGKIVNLGYPITGPEDIDTIRQVYPNSLVNMRDQVIDTVGQISTNLPLWMTSKQKNGRVLGFTPAWVMCYTNPGKSAQIAYYIETQFGEQLNSVDFKVDRYILDSELSRNWNAETQRWTPTPSLTTFDRFDTAGNIFIGTVDFATDLAYSDVNNRTLSYINALGGLDGTTTLVNNRTLIFVKQQNYNGPPGSRYPVVEDAWQKYLAPYDSTGFQETGFTYDQAVTISIGDGSSADQRMAIYVMNIDPETSLVTLTLQQETFPNEYVQVLQGNFYRAAQLRHPVAPAPGLTRISWLPLETEVTSGETIFDQGSMAFANPVDMYDPTDRFDKYLVFPKTNILV